MTTTATTPAVRETPNFRTNADQLVNFFGHGEYLVKYLGKCPVSDIRLYDMPGAAFPDHAPTTLVAAEYDMTGPDLVYSWLASNDSKQYHQALALAKESWMPGPAQVGPITSIHINGRRWFDRVNGNTYFSATGIVNGVVVATIEYRYGYSNQYEYEMADKLAKLGFMPGRIEFGKGRPSEQPWNYAERTGCKYTTTVSDVSRKRDL